MEQQDPTAGNSGGNTAPLDGPSACDVTAAASLSHDHDRHPVPSPEHSPRTSINPDLRNATKLDTFDLETRNPETREGSPTSVSSGSVQGVSRYPSQASTGSAASHQPTGFFASVQRFWRRNVVLSVAQKQSRDHFADPPAALERTFLAYIRTSVAFSILGVFIAQFFTLQHVVRHDPEFGFYRVGLPLSCACYGAAIVVALVGAYRFWRQQSAMAVSKVYAGGWELNAIGALTTAAICAIFVLVIVITSASD